MSLEQLRVYLQTDEVKKNLVENARKDGYEVAKEDLEYVTGGLLQAEELVLKKREKAPEQRDESESTRNHWGPNWGE